MAQTGRGAVHRRADGRYAQLDPARGHTAALRRGVHHRPLHHRRRLRRHRGGRPCQPFHRRRPDGDVRPGLRPGRGVPAGDRRDRADRPQRHGAQPHPGRRDRRAHPLRHRRARQHRRGGGDRLRREPGFHHPGRSRQCRDAPRDAVQAVRLRSRGVGGGLRAVRLRHERAGEAHDDDPRARGCAAGLRHRQDRRGPYPRDGCRGQGVGCPLSGDPE